MSCDKAGHCCCSMSSGFVRVTELQSKLYTTHGHSVIKTTTESIQRQQGSDDHSALSDLVAEMESLF